MTRRRHFLVLTALLGLGCLVQTVVIRRATVPGLDAVRFVGMAKAIDQQGWLAMIRTEPEQPLFPTWVWCVHEGMEHLLGPSRSSWATAGQVAAAIPLVLTLIPLYFAIGRLVGWPAAVAGTFLFCLLPEVSRLGADGISDSTHLLFFCVAFWAIVEYLGNHPPGNEGRVSSPCGSPAWLLLAGLAAAVAVLIRVEVLVLVGALGIALIGMHVFPGRRQPWQRTALAGLSLALGMVLILGPYLIAAGALQPRTAVARLLGRYAAEQPSAAPSTDDVSARLAQWELGDGEPMSFAVKEPTVSLRRRGAAAALVQFGRKLADALGYWVGALAVWGTWCLGRRPAGTGDRFVQFFFVLFSLVAIRFAAVEGYLAPRHLLALVVAGVGTAGYGALELGHSVAAWNWRGREALGRTAATWMPVALAAVACLPQTLANLHASRLGHRQAAEWLVSQAEVPGKVLDTCGWTGLYSRRSTYGYDQARRAFADPDLAYVVLQQQELDYDSGRSRTLHRLLRTAAEEVVVFPEPSRRNRKQKPVVVYRWYPERFRRYVSAMPANSLAGGLRNAQTRAMVP